MMRTKYLSFSYKEYDNHGELNTDDRELALAAMESAVNAYAPYSKFRVGAAVRLESGTIVRGANVENAAFPSGICAERSALSNCSSNYHNDRPIAIAVSAMTEDGLCDDAPSPCGNCRQVIAEEESRNSNQIKIILAGKKNTLIIDSIRDLLPLQFSNKNLKVNLP